VTSRRYDAVVLAGGRSRRMQVADKTALTIGGLSLLDRVVHAAVNAANVIVVGPARDLDHHVAWVREEPPGGGPAAALAAALEVVTSDYLVLLAADLPLVTAEHLDRLVDAVADDGAVYVDFAGNEQWLCSAWRASALRDAAVTAGASLRAALAPLSFTSIVDDMVATDCDTPEDLRRAEELLS
jgi:molybdopterin-guanine dinucleotide biosynthesis protein A